MCIRYPRFGLSGYFIPINRKLFLDHQNERQGMNIIKRLTHIPDSFILDDFCTVLKKKMGISWTLNCMVLTDFVLNKIDNHVCMYTIISTYTRTYGL